MKLFENVRRDSMANPEQVAKVQDVIDEIHRNEYFVNLWIKVQHSAALSTLTCDALLRPFQDFWDILPNNTSVRAHPFFAVCDLAESYCFDLISAEPDELSAHEVDSPDDEPQSCYHC